MKSLVLSILCLAGLNACLSLQPYPYRPLTELPVPISDRQVALFFPGEAEPTRPFVPTYDLELVEKGKKTDRRMALKMGRQAQALGLDGVFVSEKGSFQAESFTFGDFLLTLSDALSPGVAVVGNYTSVKTYSTLSGVGFLFLDSLPEFQPAIKTEQVYRYQSEDYTQARWQLIGEISRTPRGTVDEYWGNTSYDSTQIARYILNFAPQHLLGETENWLFVRRPDGRVLHRRLYRLNDWELKRVKVRYDRLGTLREIQVREPLKSKRAFHQLWLDYDQPGRINSRTIRMKRVPFQEAWEEVYHYDTQGRLAQKTLYRITDENKSLWLKIEYSYYSRLGIKAWIPGP